MKLLEVRGPERKTTVRIIAQTPSGKVVLLEKNGKSHVPGMNEFPGGVVHGRKRPSLHTIKQQGALEFGQETDIDFDPASLVKVGQYRTYFIGERTRRLFRREVHVLYYQLPTENPAVRVNQTRKPDGSEEDFHERLRLVSREELRSIARSGKLLANSRIQYVR